MVNVISLLLLAVLGELLEGRKALKKVRENCRRNDTPVPNAEAILRKKYEFIPHIRHLLELAENVDDIDPKKKMGRLVLLRNTNPDIMLRTFPTVFKTFDQLWEEASPEFIEFLTAYQKFVKNFKTSVRDMWKKLPELHDQDFEGLPEHHFTERSWDFLIGKLPELKFYKCFCKEASNCISREDFGYYCSSRDECLVTAKNNHYNEMIRGTKTKPLDITKYSYGRFREVNKYPDDLLIFPQKWVTAYWDEKNRASDDAYYARVYDSD